MPPQEPGPLSNPKPKAETAQAQAERDVSDSEPVSAPLTFQGGESGAGKNSENRQPKEGKKPIPFKTIGETVVVISGVIGLGLLGWGSLMQKAALDETRKSNEVMLALERPRLVVEDIAQPSLSSRYAPVSARIRNVGRSVATEIEVSTHSSSTGMETEMPCDWSPKRIASMGLGPGQDAVFTTPGIDISKESAYAIIAQQQKVFLWFSISYTDPLGVRQEEALSCHVATGRGTVGQKGPTNIWRRCEGADFKRDARKRCG